MSSPDVRKRTGLDAIPADLRDAPRWLVWKTVTKDGDERKQPRSVENPARKVDVGKPLSWSTYDEAADAVRRHRPDNLDGLGFALGDGWAGVDLDGCRDPDTGEVHPSAQEIIDQLDSYTEVSPSGTGVKVFVRGEHPAGKTGGKGKDVPWAGWAQERGIAKTPEIEIYDRVRYFTVTGKRLPDTPADVCDRSKVLRQLWTTYIANDAHSAAPDESRTDGDDAGAAATAAMSDENLLTRAREAHNGDKFAQLYDDGDTSEYAGDHSAADQALMNMLAFWTGKDRERMDRLFRESALMRPKYRDRDDYRKMTIDTALEKTGEVFTPRMRRKPEDFFAYLPKGNSFIYRRDKAFWPGSSVNKVVPPIPVGDDDSVPATRWISQHRPVTGLIWWPGRGETVNGKIAGEGGLRESPDADDRVFNLYVAPEPERGGDAEKAGPWVEHIERLYPEEAEHLIRWLAYKVQHPGEKVNHAIVLGGGQGIGKDTILVPVKDAVGPWNVRSVSPDALEEGFNPWVQTVLLIVQEIRDSGGRGMAKREIYNRTKRFAAPESEPDFIKCNVKYEPQSWVPNVLGLIYTTNYRDALHLPPDDRRHFVAWSDAKKPGKGYFNDLYRWFKGGGTAHVGAYLRALDLSGFDPKAEPPKTSAWYAMHYADQPPETEWIGQALDEMGQPRALVKEWLKDYLAVEHIEWMDERRNYKRFTRRMQDLGYTKVPNPDETQSGRWVIGDYRGTAVYARADLSRNERVQAIYDLQDRGRPDTPDHTDDRGAAF